MAVARAEAVAGSTHAGGEPTVAATPALCDQPAEIMVAVGCRPGRLLMVRSGFITCNGKAMVIRYDERQHPKDSLPFRGRAHASVPCATEQRFAQCARFLAETEIDSLICKGFLNSERRHSYAAVEFAVARFISSELGSYET